MKRMATLPSLAVVAACLIGACTNNQSISEAHAARPALISDTTEISRGLAYAQRVCAVCHAVAAGYRHSPNRAAPSFTVVANTPGMTRLALAAWLHSRHQSMPNLIVDQNEIDDLAAYLASLRRSRERG